MIFPLSSLIDGRALLLTQPDKRAIPEVIRGESPALRYRQRAQRARVPHGRECPGHRSRVRKIPWLHGCVRRRASRFHGMTIDEPAIAADGWRRQNGISSSMSLLRAAGRDRSPRRGADRPTGAEVTTGIVGAEVAATAAAAAVEHGQGRVETLQHDFGRVLLDAVLVGPFAGLQRALDVNLGALLQILLGDLARGSR